MIQQEILDGNRLIAEFMGAKSTEEDHTDYNEDGSIKYTPNEDGSKWIFTTWSKPNGISDEMYKRFGWGDYTMGKWYYDTSWDWLMPVIDKIEDLHTVSNFGFVNVRISQGYTEIEGTTEKIFKNSSVVGSKIKATWMAVVEFIKWHNTIQK